MKNTPARRASKAAGIGIGIDIDINLSLSAFDVLCTLQKAAKSIHGLDELLGVKVRPETKNVKVSWMLAWAATNYPESKAIALYKECTASKNSFDTDLVTMLQNQKTGAHRTKIDASDKPRFKEIKQKADLFSYLLKSAPKVVENQNKMYDALKTSESLTAYIQGFHSIAIPPEVAKKSRLEPKKELTYEEDWDSGFIKERQPEGQRRHDDMIIESD